MLMKKLLPLYIVLGILVLGGAVYLGTHYLADNYLNKHSETSKCETKGVAHKVTIKNDKVSPKHTNGKLCDTLTITNNDNKLRLIAFGEHDHHQTYDNMTEKVIGKGQSITIVLEKTGTERFHDHDDDNVAGNFTVRD
jgi:hypothetical protein